MAKIKSSTKLSAPRKPAKSATAGTRPAPGSRLALGFGSS